MAAAAAGLALTMSWGVNAQAQEPSEIAVKAGFLFKFGPFVQWPASAFETAASPFVLCIIGDDPFGALLDQASVGQSMGGHPVMVRRAPQMDRGGPACHVLYAVGSKVQSPTETLASVQGQPVLTVTDEAHGDGSHGVIHFIVQDGRVRFQIDAHAAGENGLVVSSKLLSLAVDARPGPEGAP